ncbi:hypothetical protein G5B31_00060 [Rhodobacter sp. SGA-6-6]|uniref:hypothetical protein n=1 Tax=Rhodobacter sp. SGA-6-6 TaxID=2710882 RepID=UPI0013EBF84F|nr:hypothetical protein [Rhodobacter sp. SGA-6-6]NGM43919.1 hypothetical protein [Rhodobacter sp. SGA-6-6]
MAIRVTPLRVIALILGLLAVVAVALYAFGINPIDKFCRHFVRETNELPESVRISTCRTNVSNGVATRFFAATVSADDLRVFMAAQGFAEDIQAAALQSQRIDWPKDGGMAAMVWADGTLSYSFQRN